MISRRAVPSDAEAIARIYNEGIAGRVGTFETRPRTPAEIGSWFDGRHPIVVVEEGGKIAAFAAAFKYRDRECYRGVAEFSVYVDSAYRRRGIGRRAMESLIHEAREAGFWKLLSRIFVENEASRALMRGLGFREVGMYERHGQLDGVWKDVVIVEKLIDG